MNKEFKEQAEEYVGDILNYLDKNDFSSAQRMLTAFRKAIAIWKIEEARG